MIKQQNHWASYNHSISWHRARHFRKDSVPLFSPSMANHWKSLNKPKGSGTMGRPQVQWAGQFTVIPPVAQQRGCLWWARELPFCFLFRGWGTIRAIRNSQFALLLLTFKLRQIIHNFAANAVRLQSHFGTMTILSRNFAATLQSFFS